jgi:hypothetical protein
MVLLFLLRSSWGGVEDPDAVFPPDGVPLPLLLRLLTGCRAEEGGGGGGADGAVGGRRRGDVGIEAAAAAAAAVGGVGVGAFGLRSPDALGDGWGLTRDP